MLNKKIDLIIFSSVLQYISFHLNFLKVSERKVNKILVLRTPFSDKNNHIKFKCSKKYL